MKTGLVLLAGVTAALLLTISAQALRDRDCFDFFSGAPTECTQGDVALLYLNWALWVLLAVLVVVNAGLALHRLIRRRAA